MSDLAAGVTTIRFAVGLSAVIGVSLPATVNVMQMQINHTAGGTLIMGGVLGQNHGTLLASGVVIKDGSALPTIIEGAAPLAFAAVGSTVTVSILSVLRGGYAGQY